jgi:hypothetical protein
MDIDSLGYYCLLTRSLLSGPERGDEPRGRILASLT